MNILNTIITILLSGLSAAIITIAISIHREKKRIKMQLLSDIVGKMGQLTEGYKGVYDLGEYLNSIYVIYNSSDKVIKNLENLKNNLGSEQTMEKFLKLVKSMCDEVNISYKNMNDTFVTKPFNIQKN